jgi:hypothetical protein
MTHGHPEPVEGREERLPKTRLTSLSRILLHRKLKKQDLGNSPLRKGPDHRMNERGLSFFPIA